MSSVHSKDGTAIAFERSGEGPPVILVDGAMCYREVGWSRKLAKHLAGQFTVYAYDRRGRGQSEDSQPYAAEREIEDLRALIAEAGGSAFLYAHSSGGALALETSARDSGVRKLVVYEAPFNVDGRRPVNVEDYPGQLHKLLAADRRGRRGQAVPATGRTTRPNDPPDARAPDVAKDESDRAHPVL